MFVTLAPLLSMNLILIIISAVFYVANGKTIFESYFGNNQEKFNKAGDELFKNLDSNKDMIITESDITAFVERSMGDPNFRKQQEKVGQYFKKELFKIDRFQEDQITYVEFMAAFEKGKNTEVDEHKEICALAKQFTDPCYPQMGNSTKTSLKSRVFIQNQLCEIGVSHLFQYSTESCIITSKSCLEIFKCHSQIKVYGTSLLMVLLIFSALGTLTVLFSYFSIFAGFLF